MFAKFHKIGVASAVAVALGGAGVAQALTLGEPGDALLVPHVIYDSQAAGAVNTLIGIIVALNVSDPVSIADLKGYFEFPTWSGTTPACEPRTGESAEDVRLHYYFYDEDSIHRADGQIVVTCEDFVRFDWGNVVKTRHPSLDGTPGYLVITDNRGGVTAGSAFAFYGAAFLIQGNWASQAYIPVLPLRDLPDGTVDARDGLPDEVVYGADGIPADVNPIRAGMILPFEDLPYPAGFSNLANFSLRYFLDPALSGGTDFVLWFPDSKCGSEPNRTHVTVDVYDADEEFVSTAVDICKELNVLDAAKIDGTINSPSDPLPDLGGGDPIDTGFVLFHVDDGFSGAGPQVNRAGVAFSLIGINGASQGQVQTELAHERGLR